MLVTIFGINAVGKDAVANKIKEERTDYRITSESRLLMYNLGIIDDYNTSCPVTKEQYKALESISPAETWRITNGVYKEQLERFNREDKIVLLLSHLVFALHLDKEKPVFLKDRGLPSWLPDVNLGFIQLIASPKQIMRRRIKDNSSGERRRDFIGIQNIIEHQRLCDEKWASLTKDLDGERYAVINNNNLDKVVYKTRAFIDNLIRNK